jgi:DNA-binding HxlR family transcriptional regulator
MLRSRLRPAEYASCDSPFACAAAPIIARKWLPVVVCHLLKGPKRFSELRRNIPHVSAKVLTENLRFMEGEGMLLREARGEQPVEVWYHLSSRGKDLARVIDAMNSWGKRWLQVPPTLGATDTEARAASADNTNLLIRQW